MATMEYIKNVGQNIDISLLFVDGISILNKDVAQHDCKLR